MKVSIKELYLADNSKQKVNASSPSWRGQRGHQALCWVQTRLCMTSREMTQSSGSKLDDRRDHGVIHFRHVHNLHLPKGRWVCKAWPVPHNLSFALSLSPLSLTLSSHSPSCFPLSLFLPHIHSLSLLNCDSLSKCDSYHENTRHTSTTVILLQRLYSNWCFYVSAASMVCVFGVLCEIRYFYGK